MYKLLKIFAVVLLAVTAGTSSAQFYSDRDHDQGTDTLRVYNSWQSIFFDGPDTVAVNPNVEIFSPFKFKFKPTEKSNKQLKNMIQKQSLALSLGDSVWFINSRYLRDSLNGPYNKIFEEYVPLYFNEKIAQLVSTKISFKMSKREASEFFSMFNNTTSENELDVGECIEITTRLKTGYCFFIDSSERCVLMHVTSPYDQGDITSNPLFKKS